MGSRHLANSFSVGSQNSCLGFSFNLLRIFLITDSYVICLRANKFKSSHSLASSKTAFCSSKVKSPSLFFGTIKIGSGWDVDRSVLDWFESWSVPWVVAVWRRNQCLLDLIWYKNLSTGGALHLKFCFVYISCPADALLWSPIGLEKQKIGWVLCKCHLEV